MEKGFDLKIVANQSGNCTRDYTVHSLSEPVSTTVTFEEKTNVFSTMRALVFDDKRQIANRSKNDHVGT